MTDDKVQYVSPYRIGAYIPKLSLSKVKGEFGRLGFPTSQSCVWDSKFIGSNLTLPILTEHYARSGIAPSTRAQYFYKCRNFVKWGKQQGIVHPLEKAVSESDLMLYVAHRAQFVTIETIEADLTAIRNYHLEHGMSFPFFNRPQEWPMLQRVISGVKRIHGVASKDPRKPFTANLMRKTVKLLNNTTFNNLALLTILNCGFYGLFRISELLGNEHTLPLRINAISFVPSINNANYCKIKLLKSKNSQFENSIVNIGATDDIYCPVICLKKYLSKRVKIIGNTYCFVWANGTPITAQQFRYNFKLLIKSLGKDPSCYNAHSLRIGGATSMARVGFSESLIKAQGRWRSQVFLDYVRPEAKDLARISKKMMDKEKYPDILFSTNMRK